MREIRCRATRYESTGADRCCCLEGPSRGSWLSLAGRRWRAPRAAVAALLRFAAAGGLLCAPSCVPANNALPGAPHPEATYTSASTTPIAIKPLSAAAW